MIDASYLNQRHIAIMAPSYRITALQLSAVMMVIAEAVSAIFVVRVTIVSGIFLLLVLLDRGTTWSDSQASSAAGGTTSKDDSDIATVAKLIATAIIDV